MDSLTPTSTTVSIKAFFNDYPLMRYKKGQILMLPGEETEYAYLLVDGRLKLYDRSYRGDEIVIDIFLKPAFFPLPLIMNRSATFLTYEAATDIVVRRAPVDAAMDFLNSNPKVVLDLLSLLYRKFDGVTRRMVRLIDSSAKTRLVYELIAVCEQSGELQNDGSYKLAVSQKEIGARIGLTRETVSREAKSLKEKNLLVIFRKHMIIPDLAKLENYLDQRK